MWFKIVGPNCCLAFVPGSGAWGRSQPCCESPLLPSQGSSFYLYAQQGVILSPSHSYSYTLTQERKREKLVTKGWSLRGPRCCCFILCIWLFYLSVSVYFWHLWISGDVSETNSDLRTLSQALCVKVSHFLSFHQHIPTAFSWMRPILQLLSLACFLIAVSLHGREQISSLVKLASSPICPIHNISSTLNSIGLYNVTKAMLWVGRWGYQKKKLKFHKCVSLSGNLGEWI